MFSAFITILKNQLLKELPGEKAQYKMASRERLSLEKYLAKNPEPKISSVLILLYPKNNTIKTTLILRSEYKGYHSGQVAFPGGKYEPGDKTLYHTALREANEELGIATTTLQLIGSLSRLYIPISNFIVYPFIAATSQYPDFSEKSTEVEKTIEVALNTLMDNSIIRSGKIKFSTGANIETPYYLINNYTVWGATAMIISEFAEVLKSIENIEEKLFI